jgi:predicted exporter
MLLLMLASYRSISAVLLAALPLLSAGLAGLAAVSAAFGTVHGITLAFGFTLIGVAQDYPLHLFSHQHRGLSPLANARALWPTLATGVASTCIAYLAFLVSGVVGLAQLACFTIVGLAIAGLTTRYALPHLIPVGSRDFGQSVALGRLWSLIAHLPRPRWLGAVLAIGGAAVVAFAPAPLWENNLATLTPVPKPLLARDIELRQALGAPDVRYLMALEADSGDEVLRRSRGLTRELDDLVESRAIDGYDLAARYLPDAAAQARRQAALPAPEALRKALAAALVGSPFKPDVFEPFLADVERARHLPPLTAESIASTPLALRVAGLLLQRGQHWTGLISFSGVHDPAALKAFAEGHPELTLLDLKGASEALVIGFRERILVSLAIAALLLIGTVYASLRSGARVRRVLAPMALTTVLIVAVLHGCGVSMSLFHLIALVLAAGLGLDYALFFEHAADAPDEQRRTLHAVLACSASTLMVFALLALSSLPVLRAIGITVSLGVISNFVLALVLTRTPSEIVDARP